MDDREREETAGREEVRRSGAPSPVRLRGAEAAIPPQAAFPLKEAGGRIVALYEGWSKPDKASEWKKKLEGIADSKNP